MLQSGPFIDLPPNWGTNAGVSTLTMDGTTTKIGFVFQVSQSGTISKLYFSIGTITTNQTLKVGLQTVDSSGKPTGTAYGGSSTATLTPTAATINSVTLGTSATATAGDVVALVVEWDSTTGSLVLNYFNVNSPLPYRLSFTSGAWGGIAQGIPFCQIEYDDGTRPPHGCVPAYQGTSDAFKSDSNPDERGIKFTLPFPARVIGAWLTVSAPASANFDIVLYDSGGSVLTSCSIDVAKYKNNLAQAYRVFFGTRVSLVAGSAYYLIVKPTQATANVTLARWNFSTSSALRATFAPNAWQAVRTDAGAWTEDQTQLPSMGLVIDKLDDGAGVFLLSE